ncbi:MAG: cbb3-type cytochrome c oxidase subunit I [Deltaproteobacteria bacterium]|nr:cbb3-type cytochrome c oxidase subunit I [Deltaproteobacteria bacterium]
MTTATDVMAPPGGGHAAAGDNYLKARRGILSWIFTLDHKRIGVMYLASILTFFMVGGLFALTVRLELWTPKGELLSPDMYNKFFTLHGAVMIFLFIIPSIPASLGNLILPLMLGTKDVAFPRLNLASYHLYVIGAVVLLYSIVSGAVDTGWTFYTPYSVTTNTSVITAVLGVFILGFSSILTGINFIVTIHKMRAPGMTWMKMPLFVWGLYATALIQVLATPVLAITLLLLAIEKWVGIGIFDPAMGGDPVLFQHFFWFYSHPAVYIMIVPGFGIVSELMTIYSRKRIFGYKPIAYSSLAIAVIGFLVWGHHMFVAGQSEYASTVFSFLTFGVAVPTAIKIFSWVATMYRGCITLTTPMLYGLAFIVLFSIGGLTGIFLGALSTTVHLHDTYFVVAHFHYTMMGGTVIAFLGGLHHWWPKFTGKHYSERWAKVSWALVFIGFNTTFIAQFLLGSNGMPRRYHAYDKVAPDLLPLFQQLHQISTVGSLVLGTGLFIALFYFAHSLLRGKPAAGNYCGGRSLEWQTTSPPPEHNFAEPPVCTEGPYEFPEIEKGAAH